MTSQDLHPLDEFNRELRDNAHPSNWRNPQPNGEYNLIAVGGGSAGIISALGTAGLGGKSALIERHLLGGDCLNYGCVPSKAVIRAARAAYQVSTAAEFGIRTQVDGVVAFDQVMSRMRRLRAQFSHHDSAERFEGLGVDVYLGNAQFTSPNSLSVDGQELRFRRCVIATGARSAKLDLPGLHEAGYLTNETVFSLTELPRRLIIIGAGPIGCELAQAFRRFGSEVMLVNRSARLLPKDDPSAGEVIRRQFEKEQIKLFLGAKLIRCETTPDGKRLFLEKNGVQESLIADQILIAVGRSPNLEGLGLETAGVRYTAKGVSANDYLQTSNSRIYAAGDICGSFQFTHAADAMARICIQNAFFSLGPFGKKRLSKLVIPWTTFTDPEVAHVGLNPQTAAEQGLEITSYREELRRNDRAVLDGEEDGFAVVHCRKGTGQIVGATIVGAHAGEMIGEITLMMTKRIPLGALGGVIHCYPTQVEILKRLGDQFNKTRLTPRVATLLQTILRFRR